MAPYALAALGLNADRVRLDVEIAVRRGDEHLPDETGLSSGSKRVIELSVDEARHLNHNHVGPGHILLGLVRETEGLAGQILRQQGASLDRLREIIVFDDIDRVPGAPVGAIERPLIRREPFDADVSVVQVESVLADLERVSDEIGYRRCAGGPGYECGLVRFVPKPEHEGRQITHVDKDVVCHVLRGRGRLRVESTVRDLAPGDICHIPARTPHDFSAVDEPLVLFYASIAVPEAPT